MGKKLILSRKGFDSSPQGGGGPSPILPDGTLLSMPIPSNDQVKYAELSHPKFGSYQKIIRQLGLKPGRSTCHLDPDLNEADRNRFAGWRPSLGQSGAAESHLENSGVGSGDLFLFFGWFRKTVLNEQRKLVWDRQNPQDIHVLFGYLEIDEKRKPFEDQLPTWLEDHPHAVGRRSKHPLNAIYIAKEKSEIFKGQPGSGIFSFDDRLVLTQKGKSRSWWTLPKSVFGKVEITYHKNAWKPEGFRCVGRGQEFVMPLTKPIQEWVEKKIFRYTQSD